MVAGPPHQRPRLEVINGEIAVHGSRASITFSETTIAVGCTDVSPHALRKILRAYDAWRSDRGIYVYQV